jgi:phosphatidylinositol dimannoside acyltransferase
MDVPRTVVAAARRLGRPLLVASGTAPPSDLPAGAREAAGERKRELVTFWLYRAGERVISALPRRLAMPAAAAVGNVAYDLAGTKKALIHDNLARPMGLPASDARVRNAARRAFRNYAKYLVDMMRLGDMTEADASRLVGIENLGILDEARAEGKGVILCTAHIGGMDMIGASLKAAGETLHVVADDTTYGRLYDHLAEARARHHIFVIGWRNLRGMFKVLRENESLVLFCDGGYRRGDVPVELCGEATTLPIGPATLAAKTGAPLLTVACRRTPDDRFVSRGLPIIHCGSTEPAEVYRATQAVADELTAIIAEDPGQWYMFRPVWPRTDADRDRAREALAAARRGEDWTKIGA